MPIAFIFSVNISYEYGVENLTVGVKYFNINNIKTIALPNEVKNIKKRYSIMSTLIFYLV
ncbi:hypothetical protein [Fusobacterium nucleatum]|uniref:hypothetical protein n=1 Tax=Fusobacterium nucleatum TaxID=851 RepID=UPI0030D1E25A